MMNMGVSLLMRIMARVALPRCPTRTVRRELPECWDRPNRIAKDCGQARTPFEGLLRRPQAAFNFKGLLVILGLILASPQVSMACEPVYDVVIYGGTSAAVVAAVQVKRMGKTAIIVCPEKHLGGMTASGLGMTDSGDTSTIGGLAREFYHRIWLRYQKPEAWVWQTRKQYGNRGQNTVAMDSRLRTMWVFEPHVAEQVFEDFVSEFDIPVYRNQYLDRENGVVKRYNRIVSITTLSGSVFRGRVFLDATYEGDLMATAGVSYHVGRESNDVYGERFNGVQKEAFHHSHYFKKAIDPYVTPCDPSSGLLPGITSESPGEQGHGDHRIQAYCFRMCLTNCPENRIPFQKPTKYDPGEYELLARVLDAGWDETFKKFSPIPNHKTDTNNHGPFSTDYIGKSYDYPEASYERRREIIEDHRRYQQGLMYFWANNPRIPEKVRDRMREWGLPKDEFVDNGHWPHQLYVRESRRMIGCYVMTEHDCFNRCEIPHSVGMGSYRIDSHNVQRYVTSEGYVQNEGDIGVSLSEPYEISYDALVPKREECANLIVPVCLSSSHIAYGSIRMEPVFMILGQSAGTAAAIAVENNVSVQDIPYETLRKHLIKGGQVLKKPRLSE